MYSNIHKLYKFSDISNNYELDCTIDEFTKGFIIAKRDNIFHLFVKSNNKGLLAGTYLYITNKKHKQEIYDIINKNYTSLNFNNSSHI